MSAPPPGHPVSLDIKRRLVSAQKRANSLRRTLNEAEIYEGHIVDTLNVPRDDGSYQPLSMVPFRTLKDIRSDLEGVEKEVRELRQVEDEQGHWNRRYNALFALLYDQYDGLGPQYTILVQNTACSQVRLEQLIAAGCDLTEPGYQRATKDIRDWVQTLQRYTEAQKSETILVHQKQAIVKVLKVLEEYMLSYDPDLWKAALEYLDHRRSDVLMISGSAS